MTTASPTAAPVQWMRDAPVRRALLEAVTIGLMAILVIDIAARARAAGGVDLGFMQKTAGFAVQQRRGEAGPFQVRVHEARVVKVRAKEFGPGQVGLLEVGVVQ